MERTIQTGLVGYGMAGQVFHTPLITSVVERRGTLSKMRYPWVEVADDTAVLLNDPELELIVVATPNTSHYYIVKAALEAGKHVVIDKPMIVTSKEASELIELAKSRRTVLSVFQNRRWDNAFLTGPRGCVIRLARMSRRV